MCADESIMNGEEPQFEIPKNIERYMAVLSRMYEREGQRQLQEIIVNSQTRVHEQWSYDNWNGEPTAMPST